MNAPGIFAALGLTLMLSSCGYVLSEDTQQIDPIVNIVQNAPHVSLTPSDAGVAADAGGDGVSDDYRRHLYCAPWLDPPHKHTCW